MAADKYGVLDAIFSLKSFAAAMLAYYIALQIGLPRPVWAIITTYIVSQPLAGAVLSKAVFRVIGTVLGATAAVALVPNLANSPELLSLSLSSWLGICVYLALLDRTPRSYVFLLAGYTASIIGFPSVTAPGAIFTTAILRVQEITLGILCASLIHGVILPQTVTARLIDRVDAVLRDACRWSADALADRSSESLHRDRRRLALDVFDIHQLSIHLPFDTARLLPRVSVVRALQDQISLILPLGAAITERIQELRAAGRLPALADQLLLEVKAWLQNGAPNDTRAGSLVNRIAAAKPALSGDWASALLINFYVRLGELVESHALSTELRQYLVEPHRRLADERLQMILHCVGGRRLHRDHGTATRSAIGVAASVLLLCAVWIFFAWPDGASAAVIAGSVGAVLASIDAKPEIGRRIFIGAAVSICLGAIYAFAILPRVTDFAPLVLALAPVFLLMGGLVANPTTSAYALGAVITLPTAIGLSDRYSGTFDSFANINMAQLAGIALPVLVLQIVGPASAARRGRRMLQITRRELALRCLSGAKPRTARWLSTTLDRVAYLYPQVARGQAPEEVLDQMLLSMRIGINLDELRRWKGALTKKKEAFAFEALLRRLAEHFDNAELPERADDLRLRKSIDLLFAAMVRQSAASVSYHLALALVGLRCNLFPGAAAPLPRLTS
ncbi:FUSC family protein [Sphingomonas sp. BIUV-7]|uniref:FUSC family protein n=1 Tax=Sphingomonas natans TaxID=3063330 RepID=A0ABT8Y798_9SPHN|nr:FUSC family protein [Sphingomonas sp. BIUV-7]MDO6414196.1 FUSC family protein [Sphingomonas sp. BIUV-7]